LFFRRDEVAHERGEDPGKPRFSWAGRLEKMTTNGSGAPFRISHAAPALSVDGTTTNEM